MRAVVASPTSTCVRLLMWMCFPYGSTTFGESDVLRTVSEVATADLLGVSVETCLLISIHAYRSTRPGAVKFPFAGM